VWELCNAICRWTSVGANLPEGVDTPVHVRVEAAGARHKIGDISRAVQLETLRLTPGVKLYWTYDHGSTMYYVITLVRISPLCFIRTSCASDGQVSPQAADGGARGVRQVRAASGSAAGLRVSSAQQVGFPAVVKRTARLRFFRAGNKHTQHGYAQQDLAGGVDSMHIPCATPKELVEYLHCFKRSSRPSTPTATRG
jgi:hypothetical protein